MNLIRVMFAALALLLPTTWTIAQAADEAPSGETKSKSKSSKKGKKKADGGAESDKKSDSDMK